MGNKPNIGVIVTLIASLFIFLAGCARFTQEPSPPQTVVPTESSKPAVVTNLPNTPSPLPDFTLPGARERYSFKEIVRLLTTPTLLSLFMKNNVRWQGDWDNKVAGGNEYAPAEIVYNRGVDDCDGHAILQAHILKSQGYEAYAVGISIIGPNPLGHNVAAYRDKNNPSEIWSLNNCGEMIGPFSSWKALAQWYIDHGYAYANGTIRLFDPFRIKKITTDHTRPSVLELPQRIIRK